MILTKFSILASKNFYDHSLLTHDINFFPDDEAVPHHNGCLLYTSPSPRDS